MSRELSHARPAPSSARARDRPRCARRRPGCVRRQPRPRGRRQRHAAARGTRGVAGRRDGTPPRSARDLRRHRRARRLQSGGGAGRARGGRRPAAVGRRAARQAGAGRDRGPGDASPAALPGRRGDPGRPHRRHQLGPRHPGAGRGRVDPGAGASRRAADGWGTDRQRRQGVGGRRTGGSHPTHRRRRLHRGPPRARGGGGQHERADDAAARRGRGRRGPPVGVPPLPNQGGQHLPASRPPGRRRRAAGERDGGERPGVAPRLPRAVAERASRRGRHRPRRRDADPGVRPAMRLLAAALLLGALASSGRAAPEATVALNFQDVDLPVLARFVSEVTGRNFILDDRVRGTVTIISPTRITPEEAYLVFQSVLQVKGFTTVPSGNFVKIVPVSEGRESAIPTDGRAGDELVTRILPLRYADAAALIPVVQPLVSKDGVLTAYPPTNRLVVVDSSPNVERLAGLIHDLDVPHSERATDTVALRYAPADELAARLRQTLATDAPGGSGLRVVPETRTNSLLLSGSPGDVA